MAECSLAMATLRGQHQGRWTWSNSKLSLRNMSIMDPKRLVFLFFHPYIEITLSCWVAIHLCIFFVSRNYSLKIHLPCQSRAAREWTSVAFTPFGFRGRDHRVETSVKCYCLQPLVDSDSMVSPNLILFSDEALLTISMVFAYLAGVVPSGQTSPRARNQNVFQHIPEPSSSHSGR